ncbi:MAG: glycosyltransferase family 2 protein [Bacteroidota bacterium]
MPALSACVITYNEERNIARCLKSLMFADEIIVVDSFSTDNTVAIAKSFTPNVIQHEWMGFGPQKNFAFSIAKGDWILTIDADEEVSPDLQKEILAAVKNPEDYLVFRTPRKNFIGDFWVKYGSCFPNYPDAEPRLFKKGVAQCHDNLVHEGLVVKVKDKTFKNHLLHYSYQNLKEYRNSMNYFSKLRGLELFAEKKPQLIFRIIFYLPHVVLTFPSYYLWKKGFLMGWMGVRLAYEQTRYVAIKHGLALIWQITGKTMDELKPVILAKGRC